MTEEDIRREITDCVKQHGAEEARKILHARLGSDPEFLAAAVKYGFELLQAISDAQNATTN